MPRSLLHRPTIVTGVDPAEPSGRATTFIRAKTDENFKSIDYEWLGEYHQNEFEKYRAALMEQIFEMMDAIPPPFSTSAANPRPAKRIQIKRKLRMLMKYRYRRVKR